MAEFLSLLEWKPLARNSLRGFATVRLGRALKISDISVHNSNGKRWASLPSKPQISGDSVQKDANGKIRYVPILQWLDREAADRFSNAVIEAVEALHPGDTGA
jgi:hypothetical protein